MSKSTLSSVVSNLVRASMGSSVSGTVADDDLDKHVAELILKEAKQKAEKYAQQGIRAYLPAHEQVSIALIIYYMLLTCLTVLTVTSQRRTNGFCRPSSGIRMSTIRQSSVPRLSQLRKREWSVWSRRRRSVELELKKR